MHHPSFVCLPAITAWQSIGDNKGVPTLEMHAQLTTRVASLENERKDYATDAVALCMGDRFVKHCPPWE